MRRLIAGLTAVLLLLAPQSALASAPLEPAAVQVLNWTAGNSVTAYTTAPTQAVAGVTTIVFENSEATGNTTDMSHTLTFDLSTPGYNHDVDLNILAYPDDGSDGRHEVEVTLTPGKYRYFCAIPGHSTMVGEFIVTEDGDDTTPPTVTAAVTGTQNSDGHYLGQATVAVTATDAQSGVASVEYELDDTGFKPYTAPVVVSALGDHTVQYRATDNDGNVAPTKSVGFRVVEPPEDTTPPTVTAAVTGQQDANGNYINTARVAVTATDAGSGVKSVEYQLDGGAWTPYTTPVNVNTPGMHMLHYRATDNANNLSPEGMAHFTVVAQDTTPPTVTAAVSGTQDANGNYVGKASVALTATDAGSGVKTVEYQLDGGAWTPYTTPVEVATNGAHAVTYRATDNANNTSTPGTATFTVVPAGNDTTPPTLTGWLTGNQNARWEFIDRATLTATATDTGGIRSIEYTLDNGPWTPYTAPVPFTTPGTHTLKLRATDNAGNVAPTLTGTFTITKTPTKRPTPGTQPLH
ncbi:copper-binding protein [Kribbella sandramycini]|uniref:Copper-binding protein n=1 Tax=Kribbella sandramycini TaxID=60450 RepID=A0A7Y4L1P5_9ACTN|nr:copper-binding protein [Kribbella sandramycini]MBB6566616.1 plastocyanin [Kribbella sandramycini]NOL42729.1 copper-binding protein [Kribbella sandramycini]